RHMVDEVIADYAGKATAEGFAEEWDLDQLFTAFRRLYPVGLTIEQLVESEGGEMSFLTAENITERMQADAQAAYDQREEELTPEVMRELERRVVLSVLDAKWREHLYEMDYLQSGIHMRGHAQRDPLVEYQREGYELFTAMMDAIKEESVGNLFNLQVEVAESPIVGEAGPDGEWIGPAVNALGGQLHDAVPLPTLGAGVAGPGDPEVPELPPAFSSPGLTQPNRPGRLSYSAPSDDASGKAAQASGSADEAQFAKVGRNEPCPCGSGKKFKLCHGDPRKR
ncbi:MAG TPA: SEC-C metal-binding domain-containing protein, partial [Streptosporangiaceae bacterium]